jgi:hypothetical protein
MEHTLRAIRITIAPMGVFMTASEANRQRVLTLLLAEREQMCTSFWAVTGGPVDGISRVSIGWSPVLPQSSLTHASVPWQGQETGLRTVGRSTDRNSKERA